MFLWHFPWGCPRWTLSSIPLYGVRTFLRRLNTVRDCPACSGPSANISPATAHRQVACSFMARASALPPECQAMLQASLEVLKFYSFKKEHALLKIFPGVGT